ncbi:Flagellar hook-length control protein FliK [Burkholderia cenocepacia KC-01]|nr:Flagellar hook-length control protein FliK [Burkholderia cenocepacia KC-01]
MHRAGRHAGLAQEAHRLRGDQRRLFGRLREHRVAGGERRGHLAHEDREREVPRADTDHGAERAVRVVREFAADLRRVVAQEVDRFADFGDRVRQRLAGFAHDQAHQRVHLRFEEVSGAHQAIGACVDRRRLPDRRGGHCMRERRAHVLGRRFADRADDVALVGRVTHVARRRVGKRVIGEHRRRAPRVVRAREQRGRQRRETMFVRQVEAHRVGTLVAVQVARQRDLRVRRAERHDLRRLVDRIGDQFLHGHGLVRNAVHERRVRAVFQQTAHEVREQRLVRADRCVHAARTIQLVAARDFLVQRLAHPVQALEFVLARVVVLARELVDRGQRVRVVRRELRVHGVRRREQLLRAREVRHVGVDLARIDRIAFEAVDLRPLDLGIPVRALHEADHQTVTAAAREIDQVVDHERAALLVALHDEADAVPARELRIEAQRLEQVERQFETVGLFRVDVQANVVAAREQRQRTHARQQLAHRAVLLRTRVARMQRRQLDRDARAFVDAAAAGRLADRVDRLFVRRVVALRVLFGRRRFAEHVVRVAEAARFVLAAVRERLGNRFAGDELLAHQAHRHVDALADQRLAAAADQTRERRRQARFAVGRHELAGDHQPPGRRVHEQRRRVADVRAPVALADLVADQRIARRAIGNAQQRFGEAHQRDAFLARQRELVDQPFDAAARALLAQRLDQLRRERLHVRLQVRGQARLAEQERHALRLRTAVRGRDRRAQHRLRLHVLRELEERMRRVVVVAVRGLTVGELRHAAVARQLGRQLAVLDPLEIREDRLLDQPVGSALETRRRVFQARAEKVVDFDAESRACHGGFVRRCEPGNVV